MWWMWCGLTVALAADGPVDEVIAEAVPAEVAPAPVDDPFALGPVDTDMKGALARSAGWWIGVGGGSGGALFAVGGLGAPLFGVTVTNGTSPTDPSDASVPVRVSAGVSPFVQWLQTIDTSRRRSVADLSLSVALSLGHDEGSDAGGLDLSLWTRGFTEQRFYPTPTPFFAGIQAGAATLTQHDTSWQVGTDVAGATDTFVDLMARVGLGAGRLLDVGPSTRLRKLETLLIARGTLRGPLDEATGTEILATWYALRNDISNYRLLAHTQRILLAHQAISGPLDVADTYLVLATIEDARFASRPSGWSFGAWLESRNRVWGFDPDTTLSLSIVPVARGQWSRLFGPDRLLALDAVQAFQADIVDAVPVSLTRVGVSFTQWYFNRYRDPVGSLDVRLEGAVATAIGQDGGQVGLLGFAEDQALVDVLPGEASGSVAMSVGWTQRVTRATQFAVGASGRVAVSPAEARPQFTVGLSSSLRWGRGTGRFSQASLGSP